MEKNLRSYEWALNYRSSALNENGNPTDILHDFYLPALTRITSYDRVAGYFRSSSLAAASQGYTAFLKHEGQMRLIVGADLQLQDVAAILAGNQQRLSDKLLAELEDDTFWEEDVRNGVALLGAMVASGQLEVRVAFRTNAETGEPLSVDSIEDGYVHEKWFVMGDNEGNHLYGSGSLNESHTALVKNAENIDVHCNWWGPTDAKRVVGALRDFDSLWENKTPHMAVYSLPDAVKQRLVKIKGVGGSPTEIDGTVLRTVVEPSVEELLRFAVLKDAPKMPGGLYLGMYTAPVEPWPHQEIVSRRLVDSWPYSYMLCDEVGLGKTIEAALAMRSLILSGRVKRALIVAPASLVDQWQNELADKAMLSFTKSQSKPGRSGMVLHTKIYPNLPETVDGDLYGPDFNIVSSGLLTSKSRVEHLRRSLPFDIVLLDEAHYARRQNPRSHSFEAASYGKLYEMLKGLLRNKSASLWLATATPMQIDSIEVYDLFKVMNRTGVFQSDPTLSMEYFSLLGKLLHGDTLTQQQWQILGLSFAQIQELDPPLWERLQVTMKSSAKRALERAITDSPRHADIKDIKQPLFAASPLSRVMMRHTRSLLELYKEHGKLNSNLATRHVRPVCAIPFTPKEAEFYDMLETYCKTLEQQIAQYSDRQARQAMGLLLSFLRLRFASSLYAIQCTLKNRLQRVVQTLRFDGKSFATPEEFEAAVAALYDADDGTKEYSEGDFEVYHFDALLKDRSKADLEWEKTHLTMMLAVLEGMVETPSKIQRLLDEIESRREGGRIRQTVIFTRFYDSLSSIRQYLSNRDSSLRIGVFSGKERSWYDPQRCRDITAGRDEIKNRFLSGEIDILLCTDAAAEGLNLQTADLLINFDLGWNPMKIEQRIGRIDRIGQKYSDIEVMNMCYLGSAEEIVYGRLFSRLSEADLVVGPQQVSLLPVEPDEFRHLETGELSLDELEEVSVKRLKEAKEATASMNMSAEDLYSMYSKMSEKMKEAPLPASLEDLWSAFYESEYLKSLGASVDGSTYNLPSSREGVGFTATTNRDSAGSKLPFFTWGNRAVEEVLSGFSRRLEDVPCVKRLAEQAGDIEVVGFAVATDEGVQLVQSYTQIAELSIDTAHVLTEAELSRCSEKLSGLANIEATKKTAAERTQMKNVEISKLHFEMVKTVALALLEKSLNAGSEKFIVAMQDIFAMNGSVFRVPLPAEQFLENERWLLFPILKDGSGVSVNTYGELMLCATQAIQRAASSIKHKKKAEILTEEVIRKLKNSEVL